MSSSGHKDDSAPRRRRYIVHLAYLPDPKHEAGQYIARIHPWAARMFDTPVHEHAFADECELIATINPLLPPGSDVRDVFVHIERPTGFYYLLHLTSDEAERLGWSA